MAILINYPIIYTGGTSINNNGTITTQWIPVPALEEVIAESEKKDYSGGCTCKKCKELFEYSIPNQSDETFICYGCRMVW